MTKSKTKHTSTLGWVAIGIGFLLASTMALWVVYQSKTGNYDPEASVRTIISQRNESSPVASDDLAAYIKKLDQESGCPDGMHQLLIQYRDFAKVEYGCGDTDATMYLTANGGEWQTISPTNNFYAGIPLCTHIKEHNIPAVLYADGCFVPNDNSKSSVIGKIIAP